MIVKRIAIATVLALLIALGFVFFETDASTSTLTGSIADAQGNPVNGYLTMQLPVPAVDTTTNTAIAPVPIYFNIVNGQIQGGAPLYDVGTLQPSNLYYQAKVYDSAGTFIMGGNYAVTGATFNLGAAIPTSITTSNISYSTPALLGANNIFTGNNTFNGIVTLNGSATVVGNGGLTFNGNSSDPAGASGMLNWRTDLKYFRFFDTAWHSLVTNDYGYTWSQPQAFQGALTTTGGITNTGGLSTDTLTASGNITHSNVAINSFLCTDPSHIDIACSPAPITITNFTTGTNGYIQLGNGFILQWFTASSDPTGAGNSYTKSWPHAFPTACFSAQVTYYQPSGSNYNDWYIVTAFSTSSVTVVKAGTGGSDSASNAIIWGVGN